MHIDVYICVCKQVNIMYLICLNAWMHTHTHLHTHAHTHIQLCMLVCMYPCMYLCTYMYVSTYVCIGVSTYVCDTITRMQLCMYVNKYAWTHTQVHTPVNHIQYKQKKWTAEYQYQLIESTIGITRSAHCYYDHHHFENMHKITKKYESQTPSVSHTFKYCHKCT